MKRAFSLFMLICTLILCAPSKSYAYFPLKESNSDTALEEAEEYYNKLPQGVKDAFESNGWQIIITDVFKVNFVSAIYNGAPKGGYVAGYTETISKSIVLSNTDPGVAINHEMGHFFDYTLADGVSETEGFYSIYSSESQKFDEGTNNYAMSDPSEYFAEAFREYIECAGYLKKCCPQTYEALDGMIAPYGGTQTDNITTLQKCESRLIKETAKQAADKLAELARLAADKILETDSNPAGSRSLDSWLDNAQDTYQDMKDNPEKWSNELAKKRNMAEQETDGNNDETIITEFTSGASAEDFDYSIRDGKIWLLSYKADSSVMNIYPTYTVDGVTYPLDEEKEIGHNYKVETIIFHEGIKSIPLAIFNGSHATNIYFPRSLQIIYDYSLGYFHPNDGEQIQIYYAGSSAEWNNILSAYTPPSDKVSENPVNAVTRWTYKANQIIGHEYKPEYFNFHFNTSP